MVVVIYNDPVESLLSLISDKWKIIDGNPFVPTRFESHYFIPAIGDDILFGYKRTSNETSHELNWNIKNEEVIIDLRFSTNNKVKLQPFEDQIRDIISKYNRSPETDLYSNTGIIRMMIISTDTDMGVGSDGKPIFDRMIVVKVHRQYEVF